MDNKYFNTKNISEWASTLKCGESIFLSGTVYCARDAAHKRLFNLIENKQPLPLNLRGAVIYYCGPTPAKPNTPIGSCGPTTSSRMDSFTPFLYDAGVSCTIGKGPRNETVVEAIKRNRAVYLCAVGGAGALSAKSITNSEVIAFGELGCESMKKITFNNFPLIVGIDYQGKSLFEAHPCP